MGHVPSTALILQACRTIKMRNKLGVDNGARLCYLAGLEVVDKGTATKAVVTNSDEVSLPE